MKIFLVEDSIAIRRLLVRRLSAAPGIRVVGEADGQEQALALIQWTKPDVVLTDLSLASGSGFTLVRELRRSGFNERIVVLSSQDLDAYRHACLSAGADAFYDKASGLETLFDDLCLKRRGEQRSDQRNPAALLRDGLTSLSNEAALHERLDQAARGATQNGAGLAIYVLRSRELSELKADLREELALQVAQRLGELSDADIVARTAADQFALVLCHANRPDEAAARAQRLSALMATPFEAAGRDYTLSVEIGMALFPADAIAPHALLTLAEASAFGAL